jgi:hypothetical protein
MGPPEVLGSSSRHRATAADVAHLDLIKLSAVVADFSMFPHVCRLSSSSYSADAACSSIVPYYSVVSADPDI